MVWDASLYSLRAQCYESQGDISKAIADMRTVTKVTHLNLLFLLQRIWLNSVFEPQTWVIKSRIEVSPFYIAFFSIEEPVIFYSHGGVQKWQGCRAVSYRSQSSVQVKQTFLGDEKLGKGAKKSYEKIDNALYTNREFGSLAFLQSF